MFKRRLVWAAIAAGSLLFMAAAPGINFMMPGQQDLAAKNGPEDSLTVCKTMHDFDSSGLCSCLSHYTTEELIHAPRITLSKSMTSFVQQFNKREGYYLDKVKTKNGHEFDVIDEVFRQYDIPVELKYLAVIESNLDKRTVSNAGAVGIWQLMPDAARTFGLKVGGGRDDRKNNYKSTAAAAKCLIYLHNMFDDWLLTLAAYNCGPGRVLSAIKKSGSREYWALQQFLPAETRGHVKKFIAIHYYFEGHGSLVTMTKKETLAHIDAAAVFAKTHELQKTDSLLVKTETAEPEPK